MHKTFRIDYRNLLLAFVDCVIIATLSIVQSLETHCMLLFPFLLLDYPFERTQQPGSCPNILQRCYKCNTLYCFLWTSFTDDPAK